MERKRECERERRERVGGWEREKERECEREGWRESLSHVTSPCQPTLKSGDTR